MSFKLNLLIAEDNAHDQLLVDHLLAKSGFGYIHYAWTGTEVVDYLCGIGPFTDRKKFPYPDVLLLDLELPGLSGRELLAWMGAHPKYPRPKTYILTGLRMPALRTEFESYEVAGFFEKPLTLEQISSILGTEKLPPPSE